MESSHSILNEEEEDDERLKCEYIVIRSTALVAQLTALVSTSQLTD